MCQTSGTILRKQPKAKNAHWVTASTLAILDDCNKAGKKYKRTRQQAHKDEWHRLQTRVSKAFDNKTSNRVTARCVAQHVYPTESMTSHSQMILPCSNNPIRPRIIKKTEQMHLNQPDPSAAKLSIDNQDIEVVEDFKYLGSFVGSTEHDVRVRIGLAWAAFAKLKTILRSPKPTVSFKIRIFQAACISILLYGCESWILTTALAKKLDIFARTCYRIILGVKQSRDHITDEVLYQRAGSAN